MDGKLLPADTYIVLNKSIITSNDKKKITMLYQPVIGHTAVSLYLTLLDDLDISAFMSNESNHHHLMSKMQLRLTDIIIAREKLEAVGLIKTYFKESDVNNYVYVLFSPLSYNEFLNHPILSVVLYNNIGKVEFEKLISSFKIPRINLREYKDITANFDDVFRSVNGNVYQEQENIIKTNKGEIKLRDKIDFDLLINSIPKDMLNVKCFDNDTRHLINSLSFTYNIDDLHMESLVRNSLNEKGLIDKNELIKSCRNFYEFDTQGKLPTMIYSKQPDYLKSPQGDNSKRAKMIAVFENISPNDFLRSKYKTGEPTTSELRIIEKLMVVQKMKPGVVNVLISYVLKVNNNKFTKSYVETVAAQWCRMNIETVEEAMMVAEKEHKRIKMLTESSKTKVVKTSKKEELPEWFGKKYESEELSSEEQKEIDDFLNQFK